MPKPPRSYGQTLSELILVGLACVLCACCAGSGKSIPAPTYSPTMAPTELLIDRCETLDKQQVVCPLSVFIQSIDNFADLWEYSQKCGHRLTACEKFGAVNLAEMQGHLNKQTARADKNAQWIVYTVVGGLVLAAITFVVGVVAF